MYLKMQFLPHRKQIAPLYKDQSVTTVQENNRHILNETHKNTMVKEDILNITAGGAYIYHCALTVKDILGKWALYKKKHYTPLRSIYPLFETCKILGFSHF